MKATLEEFIVQKQGQACKHSHHDKMVWECVYVRYIGNRGEMGIKLKRNVEIRNWPGVKGMKDMKEGLVYAETANRGTPKLWLDSEEIYARLFFILHTSSH